MMDKIRLANAALAAMEVDGMSEGPSPKVFRGNTVSAVRVLAEALAAGVVTEVEEHFSGSGGSIFDDLVGDGVPRRTASVWAMVNALTKPEADVFYQPKADVLTDITTAAVGGVLGYLKRTATRTLQFVSSIPWADLSGVPSVTAGAGLTGGGSLVAAITLAVAFAGTGSANTVARSDHNHTGTYLTDAPSDSALYGRRNGAWTAASTSYVAEGSNLYYTDARARTALSATSPISYNSSTGVISHLATDGNLHVPATSTTNSGRFLKAGATAGSLSWAALSTADVSGLTGWATKVFTNGSTTDVAEGSNLYYTDARSRASHSATAPISYNSSTGVISHLATDGNLHVPATSTTNNGRVLMAGSTAGVFAWTALSTSNVSGLTGWATKTFTNGSTTDVSEGSNLYYTDARARTALSATSPISYSSSTGAISHLAGDGQLHVPATSTTNSGRFLKAGATAGSIAWAALSTADVSGLTGWATKTFTNGSTTDVSEGSNLYYTDARARTALSATSPISYSSSTGVISHLSTDGSRHVPATGTTNNSKYLRAGSTAASEAWATISTSELSWTGSAGSIQMANGSTVPGVAPWALLGSAGVSGTPTWVNGPGADGSVGSATSVPVITYSRYGSITGIASATITPSGIGAQSALGFTPVNKAGDTGIGSLALSSSGRLTLTGDESNNIASVLNATGSITTNSPSTNAAIRHALSFKWYSTEWQIGNIRGGSTDTQGFGITVGATNLRWRVTNGTTYDYNSLVVSGTISEAGTALASKYLGITATAANSSALGGVSSDYFVQGTTSSAANGVTSSASMADWRRSGFYAFSSPTDSPNGSGNWTHLINSQGYSWAAGSHYSFQIAASFSGGSNTSWGSEDYAMRVVTGGAVQPWRHLWHSGNLSASTLPGGPYVPTAGGVTVTGAVAFQSGLSLGAPITIGTGNFLLLGGTGYVMTAGTGIDWNDPILRFSGSTTGAAFRFDGRCQFNKTAEFTNSDPAYNNGIALEAVNAKVGGMMQRPAHFYTTSSTLPVMGAREWCFIVCDDTSPTNLRWSTNSTQSVRIRSGNATYNTPINSDISDGGNLYVSYTTMILVGPTVAGSTICSLILF